MLNWQKVRTLDLKVKGLKLMFNVFPYVKIVYQLLYTVHHLS